MERTEVQMVNEREVRNPGAGRSSYQDMTQSGSAPAVRPELRPERTWTVRRAQLVDIPAVSRMLRSPSLADWPLPGACPTTT